MSERSKTSKNKMDKKKLNQNRREFIKKGLRSLAGAVILPSVLKENENIGTGTVEKKRKFIYRTLGNTGIKLSIVSMGSYYNIGLVEIALDSGIRLVHSAGSYQGGNHERMLGKIFKNRSRDSFVISSSFSTYMYQDRYKKKFKKNVKIKPLIESIEGSLKRLGLDYVDIYYLADMSSRETTLFAPFMSTIEKLKKEGKTRFIGVATHENEPEVLRAAADSKIYDVVLTAYNFRQSHCNKVKKEITYAAKKDLGIVAMKTQGGVYWDKERKNMINMKAALKWVLQDNNVHTAIPGFATFDELNMGLSVMENLTLTNKEKDDLMPGKKFSYSGLYCQQCGKCISQCPTRLDIPTLMRCYMYAYGYKNPTKAKETIKQMDLSRIVCIYCKVCPVICSMGFNIREKVLDITHIKDVPDDFLV